MGAPYPGDEQARLQELYSYAVLDSESEEDFDNVLDVALAVTGAARGTITFVDSDRQWFKSRRGVEAGETPRDISFCAHGILSDELLVVPDARCDPRFSSSPLVTGEFARGTTPIIFYAGAPLITTSGHRIGMLCVHDSTPRSIDETARRALRKLAHSVVRLLELRRERFRSNRLLAALNHREFNTLQVLSSMLSLHYRRMQDGCADDWSWLPKMRDRLNAMGCLLQRLNPLTDRLTVSLRTDLLPILTDMFVTTQEYTALPHHLRLDGQAERVLRDSAYSLLLFWYESASLLADAGCDRDMRIGIRVNGDEHRPELRCSARDIAAVRAVVEADLRIAMLETLAGRLGGSFQVETGDSEIICYVG